MVNKGRPYYMGKWKSTVGKELHGKTRTIHVNEKAVCVAADLHVSDAVGHFAKKSSQIFAAFVRK